MSTNASKPFILVDGSSYLYRAFHALPPLTNSKGQPTGAIYGVCNMLRKLVKDYEPEHIVVVFDAKGKTFRDDLFAEYKATRPPMPDELKSQIEPLHQVIKAMGLPLMIIDGVEADDVIGTLAVEAEKKHMQVIVSTGDKDMAQLVNKHITLVNTMSNSVLDIAGVKEKFGVGPELIIDYLSLIGDTVDNIPGVPKVGPKTAVKWLNQYGSLEKVIQHADEITGAVGESLRNNLEKLPLSQQLTTIKCDVPLEQHVKDLKISEPDQEALVGLFKELEFKSWLSELSGEKKPKKQTHYKTILDKQEFEEFIKILKKSEQCVLDTETNSLDNIEAELVGLSFSVEPHTGVYIPMQHDYVGVPKQLSLKDVLKELKPLLESDKLIKIGQNLKYDLGVLANYDIHLQGIAFDTMLESYVYNSSATRHNMDALALKYLGHETIHYEDVAGKGAKQIPFHQVTIEKASEYSAEDADITLQLHDYFWPKIKDEKGLKFVFEEIEMPLLSVLSRMERYGVLIDENKLTLQSKQLGKRIEELEQQAFKLAGEEFNLSSPKQLQEILFQKLKLPVLQKTPTGQPSTGEETLQDLALDYPLPKIILEYRSLSKLKSTYTDALPKQISSKTGRVHTSYNQAIASTGRLSSTNPNLQNIPIKTEEGRKIRQAFIAPKKYKILAADYSQIELRIIAHISQDARLVKAFLEGHDIHTATAAEVFGVKQDKVTSEQRRCAKVINFGLMYGMSAFGLAKQLGVTADIAKEYIEMYFHRYPGVKKYMEETRKHAHEKEYVETLFGRRLYLPEINSRKIMLQRASERAAINAPMQGTAADIIKKSMIAVDHWLQSSKNETQMIMQVHDELVFEVPENQVDSVSKKINDLMTTIVKLDVPLIVNIGVGNNWDEAH
ncbi:MAG: DNA polymerase I [Gammaproteobacteria bacterium]